MKLNKYSKLALLISLALPTSIQAASRGDFKVYIRAFSIQINNDNTEFELNRIGIPNTNIEVSDASGIGFAIAYMATPNVSIEMQLGGGVKHSTRLIGLDQMGVPSGTKIMDTTVISPAVTALFHFRPESNLRPYAGIGLNYTVYYNETFTDFAIDNLGATNHSGRNSAGLTVQAGVDFEFSESWLINANVIHSQISNDGTFTTDAGLAGGEINVDPYIISVGVGKRF